MGGPSSPYWGRPLTRRRAVGVSTGSVTKHCISTSSPSQYIISLSLVLRELLHINTRTYSTCAPLHTLAHTHAHTRANTQSHRHMHTHRLLHTHIHTITHGLIHLLLHTLPDTHKYAPHTHTHTHTAAQTFESLAEDVACGPGVPVGPNYRNAGLAISAEEKG